MKTWKQKHNELVEAAQKHITAIEELSELLNDFALGNVRFVCRLPSLYSDEFQMVYEVGRRKQIIIARSNYTLGRFNSLEAARDFYGILSDSAHNLEAIRRLQEHIDKATSPVAVKETCK